MEETIIYVSIAIIALIIGAVISTIVQRNMAGSRANAILDEARNEAEVLKKNKLLEAREEELKIVNAAEKQAGQRMQKIQQTESRLKQRELQLNQQQSENQRARNENEQTRTKLQDKLAAAEARQNELDSLKLKAQEELERVSGLSSEEAKEKLIENLKDEAKTAAQSYINDIMDEAKLTANKEAKRIVVQSIQRVATETAIENSVTVFQIDSDEIKGRIIGREGRNIRALEAATGIEIIVDDTPEAIVLSGFDPVRREIARLALHQLVTDGRIHPARIEEVVAKVRLSLIHI